jgi:hypothetical protein
VEAARETVQIALHDVRRSLKSAKGLVLLALYLGSFLLAGVGFVLASEGLARQLRERLEQNRLPVDPSQLELNVKTQLFTWFAGGDEALARSLAETPMIVLFFFGTALLFLPALVSLMGYDAVAGDVQGRTIRYTLLRARRGSYVCGKFLGQAGLLAVFTLAANVALLLFANVRVPGFELSTGLASLARYWSLAMLYGLVFVALALLASASTRVPLLALLLSFAGLFGFGVLWMLGASDGWVSVVAFLSPFRHWGRMFSPHAGDLVAGIGIYLAFIAALLAGAWGLVRARDL